MLPRLFRFKHIPLTVITKDPFYDNNQINDD